jgi:CheY-like chemotaxis protein
MTAGWTVRPMMQLWLAQDVSLAPTIAPHSLGVVAVASWGPAGTARASIPGWKSSTSGTAPGRAAVARQGVSPMTVTHAGLTAIGRAGRLVDRVGGESAAKRRPPVVSQRKRFADHGKRFELHPERPLRVLIVEDHPIYTELLLRSFQRHDWVDVVGCALNGRDGVALASATKPDVVLMDIEMPVMDGIEATKRILDELSPAVFVLTASVSAQHHGRALAAGARAVLPKTIDPALLIGHLQNVYLERTAVGNGDRRARILH